jgi:SAM-dependent methyltransferase
MSAFKDHFSDRAARYAEFRPRYPAALADYLASLAKHPATAWDVGCGSGQMSTLLGDRFERVIATDASEEQVSRAAPHPRVEYIVAPAERVPIADACVDLIVVAQAAHWFDLPAFYMEARRVAKARAAIALITYAITEVEPPVGEVVDRFYHQTLKRWWPLERRHTENLYADLPFPFAEISPPPLTMSVDWSMDQLLGYISTWSAVRALEKGRGDGALRELARDVRERWGDSPTRRVSWPLGIRVGRMAEQTARSEPEQVLVRYARLCPVLAIQVQPDRLAE